MVNFQPLKAYMFYCLDKLIRDYDLKPPFLGVGCGNGDLSGYVAAKGWNGKAIDFSDVAIASASDRLKRFPRVIVEKRPLTAVHGTYRTVFLWDVLEHIQDDEVALGKIASLLSEDGHILASVPSNPREWRWDDNLYGHYRRYTADEITAKLIQAGLEVLLLWDFTYPFFWIMRRAYVKLQRTPQIEDLNLSTRVSSTVKAWDNSFLARFLDGLIIRSPLYELQFRLFRNQTARGHEMFVLARKMPDTSA